MNRTLAVVLFGFSLLIQSQVASAVHPNSIFVRDQEEAKTQVLWQYQVDFWNVPPVGLLTHADSVVGLEALIDQALAQRYLTRCGPNKRQPFTCYVTKLAVPVLNPFEHSLPEGTLYGYQNQCHEGITSYALYHDPVNPAGICLESFGGRTTSMYFYTPIDVACPVPDLKDKPTDACSVALEAGNGIPVPSSDCPATPVLTDPLGEPCLKGKLAVLGIPYAGPTATIRTAAYQAHLGEVFDKFWQHQWLITDPVTYEQCTAKRKVVEGEMSKHEIDYAPAPNDSKHLDGRAFDVSRNLAKTLEQTLRQTGRSVSRFLAAPPACNLGWGGTWPSPDKVHFYTP